MSNDNVKSKTEKTIPDATVPVSKTEANATVESQYTVDELISASKAFETVPEVIAAAMKEKGISKATKTQARAIIDEFLKRVVQ